MAYPRTSRTTSGKPFSSPTAVIHNMQGVFYPMPFKNAAEVKSEML